MPNVAGDVVNATHGHNPIVTGDVVNVLPSRVNTNPSQINLGEAGGVINTNPSHLNLGEAGGIVNTNPSHHSSDREHNNLYARISKSELALLRSDAELGKKI